MGSGISRRLEIKTVILGLDGSGKTTLLYKYRLGVTVAAIPTYGFNVERFVYRNLEFLTFDVSGLSCQRRLWRYHLANNRAVIFVVDASDKERLEEARQELDNIITHPVFEEGPLLVMANKQDVPSCMNAAELYEFLNSSANRNADLDWHVEPTCITQGTGIYQGLDWMIDALVIKRSCCDLQASFS